MVEIPPMRDVLAIVGSTDWDGNEDGFAEARELIARVLSLSQPDEVISGGAAGIDGVAIMIAKAIGIPTREFYPENDRWAPYGYKARNIIIARTCTRLLCVRSHVSKTFGSGWTANLAEKWGKPVERHTL